MTENNDTPSAADVSARPIITKKQPCPCGSGKKYKHCCFVEPAVTAAPADADASEAPVAPAARVQQSPPGHPMAKGGHKHHHHSGTAAKHSSAMHRRRV